MAIKVKIRTTDHGQIGGFSAEISLNGGETWKRVPMRYVGAGLVSFDNKAQAVKYATIYAKEQIAAGGHRS
jgi:hypothetical protein